MIEAVFAGSSQAIPLVLHIAANIITVLALLAALDNFLSWFGSLVDHPQLSFHVRCLLKRKNNFLISL